MNWKQGCICIIKKPSARLCRWCIWAYPRCSSFFYSPKIRIQRGFFFCKAGIYSEQIWVTGIFGAGVSIYLSKAVSIYLSKALSIYLSAIGSRPLWSSYAAGWPRLPNSYSSGLPKGIKSSVASFLHIAAPFLSNTSYSIRHGQPAATKPCAKAGAMHFSYKIWWVFVNL